MPEQSFAGAAERFFKQPRQGTAFHLVIQRSTGAVQMNVRNIRGLELSVMESGGDIAASAPRPSGSGAEM